MSSSSWGNLPSMSEISSWRELLEFRVALVLELLFGRDELIGQRDVLTRGGRELALARMFFGKARVLLLVGEHGWVAELRLELLVGSDYLRKLVVHLFISASVELEYLLGDR